MGIQTKFIEQVDVIANLDPGSIFITTGEHWDSDVTSYGLHNEQGVYRPCKPTRCVYRWTNCDGKHINVVLPDGAIWVASGRANNCTLPGDQEHRCWVLSGAINKLTASKNGKTCDAGAGSIQSYNGWHGFLRDGILETA